MVTITLIIIETLESKAAAIRAQVACYPVRRAARASPQCRVRVLARYSYYVRKLRILRRCASAVSLILRMHSRLTTPFDTGLQVGLQRCPGA